MSILITRPLHDAVTHYLYHWSESLVEKAKSKKLSVIDLQKEKASRKLVESYLEKQHPDTVIFNGHGDDVCVTGQDEEVLIEAGKNSYLLKDKVVYMRACDSGKVLGPKSVEEGAEAFIGYKELFRFWTDGESIHKPLKDEYAKPFFETSNQVALSLIKGKSAKESHDDSLKVYTKVISDLLTSKSSNSFVVADLIWNMYNQVCLEKQEI